ncbi:hypothetical protein BT69DRAFT_192541 [Atractiella rhizophila]|nr:hypothetical protein BT69DRAFT_192541 [Atractiella rhizophila]
MSNKHDIEVRFRIDRFRSEQLAILLRRQSRRRLLQHQIRRLDLSNSRSRSRRRRLLRRRSDRRRLRHLVLLFLLGCPRSRSRRRRIVEGYGYGFRRRLLLFFLSLLVHGLLPVVHFRFCWRRLRLRLRRRWLDGLRWCGRRTEGLARNEGWGGGTGDEGGGVRVHRGRKRQRRQRIKMGRER